jgi:predicted RNase H-like HicB family nuclease
MKLRVVLEPSEEGGYTGYVPSLPGCASEGDSKEEALTNIREAIELYLEPVDDDMGYNPNAEITEYHYRSCGPGATPTRATNPAEFSAWPSE